MKLVSHKELHNEWMQDDEYRAAWQEEVSPQTTVVRKQAVEHLFGTIKMWMGVTHFLTKRFKNVSTEISLHVLV